MLLIRAGSSATIYEMIITDFCRSLISESGGGGGVLGSGAAGGCGQYLAVVSVSVGNSVIPSEG